MRSALTASLTPGDQSLPLTVDEMHQLLRDAVNGKEQPSLPGKEALQYFQAIRQEVAEMMAKGIMPTPVKD